MKQRILGGKLMVSEMGLGCMGMSEFYGKGEEAEQIATIHRAIELGVSFFDTADMYGPFTNEMLVGKALKGKRDSVVLATKFGNVRTEDGGWLGVNGTPEYARKCIDESLKRLDTDYIDLYYLHRVDPNVPIEETVGAMSEMVKAGKVRYIGLSEAAPETVRRAHQVHPLTALQTEYSLWSRDPEGEIFDTVRELNIGFVSYSPLGRGFLTGRFKKREDFNAEGDTRATGHYPRFWEENFDKNLHIVEAVEKVAKRLGVTPAQIALAWVMAKGKDMVPIPGTKHIKYLEENIAAAEIELSADDIRELEEAAPKGATAGDRYQNMGMVDR